MALRAIPLALLAAAALGAAAPASAPAAFTAPFELAGGPLGATASAATDAGGVTTAVLSGLGGAPKLVQRPAIAAPWGPLTPLPGVQLGRAVGPVVSAAGEGAAAVAWRIDTPHSYQAIAATARDPGDGGPFAAPEVVSPPDANGTRHPAIAVDGDGAAVLAYNTNTRTTHLSIRGAIAVSLRPAHGSFAAPVVVDARPSTPPAVAIGPDGRGIVAWTRDGRLRAATVDAATGRVGKATTLTPPGTFASVRAAAGPDGAATLAFQTRTSDASTARFAVGVLRRTAGGRFPATPQYVDTLPDRSAFLDKVVIAADEAGRTTIAWAPERFGGARGEGVNGVTSGVRAATAAPASARFGRAQDVVKRGRTLCDTPALAATANRAVLAWWCRGRGTLTVWAATATDGRFRAPQPVLPASTLGPASGLGAALTAGLDATGHATVLVVRPDPPRPRSATTVRVLATTGR